MGGGQAKATSIKQCNKHKYARGVPQKRSILMLGIGGVGKTVSVNLIISVDNCETVQTICPIPQTIVKQLTMRCGPGLSENKKAQLCNSLRSACVKRICDIVDYAADDEQREPVWPRGQQPVSMFSF